MSRAPLLVRSSPAQGTGSYGGLPVLSMSSSPGDSDVDDGHVTTNILHRSKKKKKGKSKLRESEPAFASNSRSSLNRSQDDVAGDEPVFSYSRARRRSTKDESSASRRLLNDAFQEQDESGLEPRFNSSGVAGAPRIFEPVQSSSSSSYQAATPDDEQDSSDTDELHDLKSNGSPSDNSPYSLVRASVAATDDITLSINTPRMWFLSILFAIIGSSTNLFFSLRYPSVSITPIIALLLVHPLGLLWDQIFKCEDDPEESFHNGSLQKTGGSRPGSRHSLVTEPKAPFNRRLRLWLAQGRWNEKEHCCVYISSNVSFGFAFATDVGASYQKLSINY